MIGLADVRPLRREDDQAVAAFFAEAHSADPSVRPVSADRWRAFVEYAGNAGGRDFAVAEQGGRVVGILTSVALPGLSHGRARRHLRIVVLPRFRRRGIGSALLRHAESQPLDGPRPALQAYVPESWSAALAFFRARGFETVHEDLEMERDGPAPASVRVDGYSLRPFRRGPLGAGESDAEAWARLHNEAYARRFVFEPFDAARAEEELRIEGARATVAETGGIVAGLCFTHTADPDRGCVQSLVVDSRHRRRGLGRALLAEGLRALALEGRAAVELGVDGGNKPACALYVSMGFRAREMSFTLWRDR